MRFRVLLAAVAMLSVPAILPARAGGDVHADGQTGTVACAGADASVSGNRNTVTFTGACKSLTIRGDGNRISAALAGGAGIDVAGNGNRLRYTAPAAPKLRVSGNGTDISPVAGTPAPAADDSALSGDDEHVELNCADHAVTVQGNRSQYRLRGGCQALTVRGEANKVEAELQPGAAVLIEGNGTTVTYTLHGPGPEPVGTVRGVNSLLQAGAPVVQSAIPAAPPVQPVPVPPAGRVSVPQLMHDLQGTVVEAGTLVHLAAVLFDGPALAPAAEAPLGQLAALIGKINPSGLAITGRDPSDPAVAAQRAAAVRAWLEQQRKTPLPTQVTTETGPDALVDVLILR